MSKLLAHTPKTISRSRNMSSSAASARPASNGNKHTDFARSAFSISGASGLYDRARPNYPSESLTKIYSFLPPSAKVVEIGSGTGLFTRMFISGEGSSKIESLLCVEPAEGMRKGFLEKGTVELGKDHGVEVKIEDGLFDNIPLEDGTVDMVIAAQAFHWIGHDVEPPVKEIGRVLKPNGVLALIWNLEDREAATWVAELRDAYEVHEQGTPQYRHGYWKTMFQTASYKSFFEEAELVSFKRALPSTEDKVVDRVLSKSFITSLQKEDQSKVEAEVRRIVKSGKGKKWIDQKEGTFEYPYATDLYIITKKAS